MYKTYLKQQPRKKSLRAKCHVRLSWLIKRLLCRLVTWMGSSVTLFKALYCLKVLFGSQQSARWLHCKQFLKNDTCNPKLLNDSTSCNQMSPSPKYTVHFTRSIFKKMNVICIINGKDFTQIDEKPRWGTPYSGVYGEDSPLLSRTLFLTYS